MVEPDWMLRHNFRQHTPHRNFREALNNDPHTPAQTVSLVRSDCICWGSFLSVCAGFYLNNKKNSPGGTRQNINLSKPKPDVSLHNNTPFLFEETTHCIFSGTANLLCIHDNSVACRSNKRLTKGKSYFAGETIAALRSLTLVACLPTRSRR